MSYYDNEPPRCWERIGNGHCRNKPYRFIGAHVRTYHRTLEDAPHPPFDMRCRKHWEEWHHELFTYLYGRGYKEWFK
jgi:hypothetical protein